MASQGPDDAECHQVACPQAPVVYGSSTARCGAARTLTLEPKLPAGGDGFPARTDFAIVAVTLAGFLSGVGY
jgi:hypothetical protein